MTTPSKVLFALLILFMPCLCLAEDAEFVLPDGFCYVQDVIPDVILDIRYAGEHNFTGTVIDGYVDNTAILTKEAAEALSRAADTFREMGYRIKIFDAYRPQRAVKHFVRWSQDAEDMKMQAEFYPEFSSKKQLVDKGYIARNSSHMRGSALDMTLTDPEGKELDMGTCFDFFSTLSWHDAKGIAEEAAGNRNLLKKVMEENGFKPFQQEWWHYRLINEPFKTEKFDFPVQNP